MRQLSVSLTIINKSYLFWLERKEKAEKKMKKGTLEKFSVTTIKAAVSDSDLQTARNSLVFGVGSAVEVSGKVQKRVRRDGQCKLVIEPGNAPGFVVFADCPLDAEKVQARKIRKGSLVSVRGKLQTFGASAVCLSDCRLQEKKQVINRKETGNGKPHKTSHFGSITEKEQR